VVGDQDVDVPERRRRLLHAGCGRAGVGEVELRVGGRADLGGDRGHAGGIGAPRLAGVVRLTLLRTSSSWGTGRRLDGFAVVRLEAVHEHLGAQRAQPPRDRVADAGAAADPGDERAAPRQRPAQSPSSRAYVRR
jgi:hypothetical protein